MIVEASTQPTEQLRAELIAGGFESVLVVPDVEGDQLTISGLAAGEQPDDIRSLVEEGIVYNATLDLVILEPGVWVDDAVRYRGPAGSFRRAPKGRMSRS